MPLVEKTTTSLKCLFTDAERLEKGFEIAEKQAKLAELDGDLKSIKTQLGAQMVEAQARIDSLCNQIRTGYEFRQIECRIEYDWESETKRTIRNDTGETVRTDPISDDERQTKLELDGVDESNTEEPGQDSDGETGDDEQPVEEND